MRGRSITLVVLALAGTVARPAAAAGASMTVDADLSACAVLTFDRPTTGTGSFSAAGAVTGPGTITAPVAGTRPIILASATAWRGCLPGAYAGATTGRAVFVLAVEVGSGSLVRVADCQVQRGVVTCV